MKKNDSEIKSVSLEADRVVERLREAYTSVEELRKTDAHVRILEKARALIDHDSRD